MSFVALYCNSKNQKQSQMKKKKIKKMEDVFTPDEAAEYLGVSRRTIERAAKDGKIVRHRINGGQRVFYKKTDVEGLLTPED